MLNAATSQKHSLKDSFDVLFSKGQSSSQPSSTRSAVGARLKRSTSVALPDKEGGNVIPAYFSCVSKRTSNDLIGASSRGSHYLKALQKLNPKEGSSDSAKENVEVSASQEQSSQCEEVQVKSVETNNMPIQVPVVVGDKRKADSDDEVRNFKVFF